MAWNLWELIATRAMEGESGLIPRQEYETVSFVQQWALYPQAVRIITDASGVDGLVEMGAVGHHEVPYQAVKTSSVEKRCPLRS